MIQEARGFRQYNEPLTLTFAEVTVDEYGHRAVGEPVDVLTVFASVRRMSATKTMLTFQQADIVALEIEFHSPNPVMRWNGMRWNGHQLAFSCPDNTGLHGRLTKVQAYYQLDNPGV